MDPFLGEVRIFGFNYAPVGYAFCRGQRMPVTQNPALYRVIKNLYGGDNQYFFLPDIQGRVVVGSGQGPGRSSYKVGATGGQETVTLTQTEMPVHNHLLGVQATPATTGIPRDHTIARVTGATPYGPPASEFLDMAGGAITPRGGGAAHTNMQPWLALGYCIAVSGPLPNRS